MDGSPTIDPLAAHETRLLALSPDLLGAAGFDGHMKLMNPAWSQALGWTEQQMRETPYLEFVHPDDHEEALRVIGLLVGGGSVDDFVCRILRADGTERCFLWSAQGSPDDACFYLAGKDITERRRMEDELALRAEKLERTNAELQDFAYIASHDLAEPLRMITSYLELLQRRYAGQLDETADEFIGHAVGGAERMKTLIDDLLAYSRVGSHDLERAVVDLEDLLARILKGLERAIDEAGAAVDLAAPLAPPCGDPTQLGQLLQNLVSNAVKFRDPARPASVVVSSVRDGEGVRISVADNGIGIPVAQQERIFKMFARLHGRDEYDGTGIGLSLCRRIAERHGGRIWVDSTVDRGSTFHAWLPDGR
jgi:PAS domain S-box-containing protein